MNITEKLKSSARIVFYNLKMLSPFLIVQYLTIGCCYALFLYFILGPINKPFYSSMMLPFMFLGAILFFRSFGTTKKERINSIFISEKFPFSRWNNLFQLPEKNGLLTTVGAVPCDTFYKSLMKTIFQMSNELGQSGYYRTITHSSVKRILQHRVRQGKMKLIRCVPVYQRSFVHLQKQLLRNRCKGCPDNKDCPYYREAPRLRQFYYIEFQIPLEKEMEVI